MSAEWGLVIATLMAPLVTISIAAVTAYAKDPEDIPAGVRKRLVKIQNLLVDLLDDFESEEGISYFTKEGGRKKAGLD